MIVQRMVPIISFTESITFVLNPQRLPEGCQAKMTGEGRGYNLRFLGNDFKADLRNPRKFIVTSSGRQDGVESVSI